MIALLIFIAALVIIGFIAFLFVYNFRTKHQPPSIPPVPEFNDDFSREFNLGRRNNMPRATAPPMPERLQRKDTETTDSESDRKSSVIVIFNEPSSESWITKYADTDSVASSSDNDNASFGGGDFGGGGAGSSYDDSGSSGSSDYSSDSGSSDSGSSYD